MYTAFGRLIHRQFVPVFCAIVLLCTTASLPLQVLAAPVSSSSFYPATAAAETAWVQATSNARPPQTTAFPVGTGQIAFYFEYTGATPQVTTYTVSVYDSAGAQVGTQGPTKVKYSSGLAMRTVPSANGGRYRDGVYGAILAISGAPNLVTSFTIGSAASSILPTGPFRSLIRSDFSRGDPKTWYELTSGSSEIRVTGGRLTISLPDNLCWFDTSNKVGSVADGQIAVVVRAQGNGRVGVMARWNGAKSSNWALYAYWITNHGTIGLTKWHGGRTTDLFITHGHGVLADQDNLLVLRLQGSVLTMYLNGTPVQSVTDPAPLHAGYWGPYVQSVQGNGSTQGQFASILISG